MNAATAYALAALMFLVAAINFSSGTATLTVAAAINVATAVLFLVIGRRASARAHA